MSGGGGVFRSSSLLFWVFSSASTLCLVLPTYLEVFNLVVVLQPQQQQSMVMRNHHGFPQQQQQKQSPVLPSQSSEKEPFHVLFTLLGRGGPASSSSDTNDDKNETSSAPAAKALYDTWQVSVKSVLLNAPTDRPLHIHIMCNDHAQHALHDIIISKSELSPKSMWRNPLSISTYNVESFHDTVWRPFLQKHLHTTALDDRVSLGGYYRMLAHDILPLPKVEATVVDANNQSSSSVSSVSSPPDTVLYMDSDVVILSNLNELIPHLQVGQKVPTTTTTPTTNNKNNNNTAATIAVKSPFNNNNNNTTTVLFQGSKSWFCSGFMGLNVRDFAHFWDLLEAISKAEPLPSVGDQAIFAWVLDHFPDVVAQFPPQWDRNLGHGWRHRPHKLRNEKEAAAGMVHFQGGAGRSPSQTYYDKSGGNGNDPSGFQQYCTRSKQCNKNAQENMPMVESTWGLASYYVNVPWHWVLYFGKSMVESSKEGYPLQYQAWTAVPPPPQSWNGTTTSSSSEYPKGKLVPTPDLMTTTKKNIQES